LCFNRKGGVSENWACTTIVKIDVRDAKHKNDEHMRLKIKSHRDRWRVKPPAPLRKRVSTQKKVMTMKKKKRQRKPACK